MRVKVTCRVPPEWILFCFKRLARPNCSGKCAVGPEKCGIGPEKREFAWSLVGLGNNRCVARGLGPAPITSPQAGARLLSGRAGESPAIRCIYGLVTVDGRQAAPFGLIMTSINASEPF